MSNASHNDPKFADEPEGIMSRATDEGDDTEGHKLRPGITDDGTIPNAPEGYRLVSATDEEDDTEGHRQAF